VDWRKFLGLPDKKAEVRAINFPFNVGPPAYMGGPNATENDALSLWAVFAAVRLLADGVASLPLHIYRDLGDRRQRVRTSSLFDKPAAYGTQYDWIYQCMTSLLLHGNAYGLITSRDGYQFPTTIEWLRPQHVSCVEGDTPYSATWYYNGRKIDNSEDLFHVRAFTLAGRLLGVSPIRQFALEISAGLSAMRYGNEWFDNGGFPPGTFKNTEQTVDQASADKIKARLADAIHTRQPLVYGRDWEYTAVSVPPEEAQFLASMKLTASQIAAIYDVPPERVAGEPGGSLTYATQEQDQIRLALTVQKWCTRLENAFFGLLPERQYVRFNVDAMIRTDIKTRHDVYKIDREIGLKSIDELRMLDDLEPLPNGAGADYTPLVAQVNIATAEAQPRRALTEDTANPGRPRLVS
jgi:HK97 family phage portal protein